MPTVATVAIKAGSRWVSRNGDHAGREVEILDVRENSVQIRVAETRDHGGKMVGKTYSRPIDAFLVQYEPRSTNGSATQPAFRQRNAPKKAQAEPMISVDATTGLILPSDSTERIVIDGVVIEVVDISPGLARSWIDRSVGFSNRPMRKQWAEGLTAAIRRREWRLTFDTIKMDREGNVVDGQHRLLAIAQSGITCKALVVRGVEPDAFAVMDTGRGRTVGDILHLEGFPDRFAMAGAAKMLMLVENFGRPIDVAVDARSFVTPAGTVAYLREHPEVKDGVNLGHSIRKYVEGGPAIWGAAMTLLVRVSPEQAETFGHLIRTGEGLDRGHPVLALRKRLLAKKNNLTFNHDRYSREELLAIIIKAWNAWRQDEEIDNVGFSASGKRPESFPTPI